MPATAATIAPTCGGAVPDRPRPGPPPGRRTMLTAQVVSHHHGQRAQRELGPPVGVAERSPLAGGRAQRVPVGALLVMAAGALWGTTGTAQALSPSAASPWGLGAARLAVAAVLFVGLAALRRRPAAQVPGARLRLALPRGAWPLAALGAACVAAYQPAFFFGVRQTGVAVGTLTAIGSAPLFAGLLGLLTGARPTRRWAVGTAVVLAGLGLLLLPGGAVRVDPAGVLAALAAGAAYAAYTWASSRLLARGTPPVTMLAVLFTGAAAVLVATAPAATAAWLARPDRLAVVAYLGIAATALPYVLWARGLPATRPAVATTLSLTEPLTAALLGVLLLGEPATAHTLAGAAVVCAGLLLTVAAPSDAGRRAGGGPARSPRRTAPPPPSGAAAGSAPASDSRA